jgi:hypothetical protein
MPTSASESTMKHTSKGDSTRQRTTSGAAIAARPSVSPKFTRLLPTALPSASDCAPTQAARALTASSGIDGRERDEEQAGDERRKPVVATDARGALHHRIAAEHQEQQPEQEQSPDLQHRRAPLRCRRRESSARARRQEQPST